jgi:hypothetical protein
MGHFAFKSYPKIHAFGYLGTEDVLNGEIVVQPKVDGSNVSVWRFPDGEWYLGRRNGWISKDVSEGMFKPFVDWAMELVPTLDPPEQTTVWFGEFSNNHNKLKYDEKKPFILFDVATLLELSTGDTGFTFLGYDEVLEVADAHGLDRIPAIYRGLGSEWNADKLVGLLGKESYLGGCLEEGVVVKRYGELTRFNGPYFVKLVSTEFSEKQKVKLKGARQGSAVGVWAADSFFTPARLAKAIQKIKEQNEWADDNARKNIGKLIGTVMKDIHDECADEIADKVVKLAWKEIGNEISKRVAPALDTYMMENISNG